MITTIENVLDYTYQKTTKNKKIKKYSECTKQGIEHLGRKCA